MDCSMPGLPVPHHLPVCPSSCSLHQWCHPAISSSDALFSFYYQSFPESGTFPMRQPFALVSSVPSDCNPMDCSMDCTNSWSLLKLISIESVMPSNHLILCCPLLLPPSIFPSIGVFSNESVLWIRWPKYWSFSFDVSPTNEYSELISFRMDWVDFLAVQGTLKSPLQHHSSKASILYCSAFFIVQLSHPYMTTGKTTPLTIWT